MLILAMLFGLFTAVRGTNGQLVGTLPRILFPILLFFQLPALRGGGAAGRVDAAAVMEGVMPPPIGNTATTITSTNAATATSSASNDAGRGQDRRRPRLTDRVGSDVHDLGLTAQQLARIEAVYRDKAVQSSDFRRKAAASGWEVNRHQVYRYLAAVGWAKDYNGKAFRDAVVDTVTWRRDFGIRRVDLAAIAPLIQRGAAYVNGCDGRGRALVHFKFGRVQSDHHKHAREESPDTLLHALMYTVERADLLCCASGSGEFIAILDFEGVGVRHCPPVGVIAATIALLKWHYPYRLGGIYVVNTGLAFNVIWGMIKPLLPKQVLARTHVVKKADYERLLHTDIGEQYVEKAYGGRREEPSDFTAYLQSKF